MVLVMFTCMIMSCPCPDARAQSLAEIDQLLQLLSRRDMLGNISLDPQLLEKAMLLDSDDLSVRIKAEQFLLSTPAEHEQFLVLLSMERMGNEQRHRLLTILRHRILMAPRGALGIVMEPRNGMLAGIEVMEVLRGMPAEGILRAGDRITHIDQQEVRINSDLIEIIQSMPPGHEVQLSILRRKPRAPERLQADDRQQELAQMSITVALGSVDQLDRFGSNDNPRTNRVLMERRDLLRHAEAVLGPVAIEIPVFQQTPGLVAGEGDPRNHPEVQSIRQFRRLIQLDVVDRADMNTNELQKIFTQLQVWAKEEGQTPSSRQYRRAVVQLYAEELRMMLSGT
ncbi:MAG: hypothetical protein CMJ32_10550 [Phycisphaerae bacterium]|nr:hypothetical protein [Phycisphaerae bacterium]